MDSNVESVLLSASACIIISCLLKKKRVKPRCWVRPFLRQRDELTKLFIEELKIDPLSGFKNFTRISCGDFEDLVNKIGPQVTRQDTNYRKSVAVEVRLAITMRYLATGDSFQSLMYLFKISRQLISRIIPEVCSAIISELKEHVKLPNNQEEWMAVERQFNNLWNFPHCMGAMDGKHIVIQAPSNTGSDYFNYKNTFSIVLFALVDANYMFTYVDVGYKGRISDGGVFKNTTLYNKIQRRNLKLPPPYPLPGRAEPIEHVIVADDAFALDVNVIKPYPGKHDKGSKERVFNYRLSRARRIVENAFGILSAVFRVLRKPILLHPKKAQVVTLACIYLHNFLRKQNMSSRLYCPPGTFDRENPLTHEIIDGTWRRENISMNNLLPIRQVGGRPAVNVKNVREEFADYFKSDIGMVPWQETVA